MSIKSQIERIKGNVDASLSAVKSKGVAVPTGSTSDDLPALISSISTQSGGAVVRGCQPRNLLDNSNFAVPVNQRGATTYTGETLDDFVYSIDRWVIEGTATIITPESAKTLQDYAKYIEVNGSLVQIFSAGISEVGDSLTFAACDTDGNIYCVSAATETYELVVDENERIGFIPLFALDDADKGKFNGFTFLFSGRWRWAALYSGTYTADTLPPYVPKGYALEYLECSRYYRNFVGRFTPVTILAAGTARMTVHTTVPMRVTPTVTLLNADNIILNTSGAGKVLIVTSASVDSTEGDAIYINLGCNAGSDSLYATGSTFVTNLELDAELYLE